MQQGVWISLQIQVSNVPWTEHLEEANKILPHLNIFGVKKQPKVWMFLSVTKLYGKLNKKKGMELRRAQYVNPG